MVSEDDRARARLAALENEVRAEAATKAVAKAAALERLRAQRAEQEAERAATSRALAPQPAHTQREDDPERELMRLGGLGQGLELARKAQDVKDELSRPKGANEKSWLMSGGLSLLFGPVGWLYAGSFRESIPGAAAYLAAAFVVSKIVPTFLLMPVLLFALPLSAIAGIVYAMQYNRTGKRQRLFGGKAAKAKAAKLEAKTASARLGDGKRGGKPARR